MSGHLQLPGVVLQPVGKEVPKAFPPPEGQCHLHRGGGSADVDREGARVFMLMTLCPARDAQAAGHMAEGPVLGACEWPAGPGGAGGRLAVSGLGFSH